jgi:RNA polymerase sigma-70 factor (ECF subfamily)
MSALAYEYLWTLIAGPPAHEDGAASRPPRPYRTGLVPSLSVPGNDIALLERLRAGDETALTVIIRTHTNALVRFARVLTGNDATADDVIQDVFVSLWEERGSIVLRGPLKHYLIGAVRHRALNVIRAERTRTRTADTLRSEGESATASVNDALGQLTMEDLWRIVERALEQAAPQCRTIFLLSWRAELSYADIAQSLGISMRTVYNQMYRATKLLAAELGEALGG